MLKIFLALACAIVVAALSLTIERMLNDDGMGNSRVDLVGWLRSVGLGIVVGLCDYISLCQASWWSVLALVLITAAVAYVIWWFIMDVNQWKEWLMFFLLSLPTGFVFMAVAASGGYLLARHPFGASLIHPTFGWLGLIALFGTPIAVLFARKEAEAEANEEERDEIIYRVLTWIALIAMAVLAILALIFGPKWGLLKAVAAEKPVEEQESQQQQQQQQQEQPEIPEDSSKWYFFYNGLNLLDNETVNGKEIGTENDFNFGSNPLEDLIMDKVENGELKLEDIAKKSESQLYDILTVEEIETEFRRRLGFDPALGAADMAWFDATLKTRYLGEFYDECKSEWASTMNLAKTRWMADQAAYNRTLSAWYAFLDTATKVEVVKVSKGLDDQMYMNPYTTDLVPDIIVMESLKHDGYFLRYTFEVKDEEKTVSYRIDCGFQPTNVAKVMRVTVQKNLNSPEPTTKKSTTTSSQKKKDPTKGTDVGKNDDSGPGPDTNNGVGAQKSSEDKSTNSSNLNSYDEYKQEIQELKENGGQKVGGDSNTPSTSAPAGTNVDSNADNGNGNGGIDAGTNIHDTNVNSNLGGSTKTTDDLNGSAWGGPKD